MRNKLAKIINLAKTKTAKDTYLVLMGNSLAGFLGMVLIILISRILGPKEFGIFSVLFSLMALFSKLADFGFNFAMVREISQSRAKGEKDRIKKIFSTVFCVKIILSIFIAFLGFILVNFISQALFKSPGVINPFLLLGFSLFVFYDLVRVFFEANKRFWKSVTMYLGANLIKLILVVLALFLLPQFKDYIFIYILGPFLIALIFFSRTKLGLKLRFYKEEFKKLFKFSAWMGVSVVFAALAENLNVLMISSRLSSFETGIYSAAEKFILPFNIFAAALGTVFISRSSEFLEQHHLKSFIKKIAILQFFILLLFIFAFPLAGFLPFLLGQAYQPSVAILRILFLSSFFQLTITPFNSVFYPLGKSIIFALDAVIQVIILFSLNYFLLPRFQAMGAAISLTLANGFIFCLNYLFLYFVLKKK